MMPFVTEELWQSIRSRKANESIMRSSITGVNESHRDPQVEKEMAFAQKIIEEIRTIRGEMRIPPSKELSLIIRTSSDQKADRIEDYRGYLQRLARVTSLKRTSGAERPRHSASAVVEGEEIFIPLEGIIDITFERKRLQKEINRITGVTNGIRKKLDNRNFREKAPADVVEKERAKLDSMNETLSKFERNLAALIEPGGS